MSNKNKYDKPLNVNMEFDEMMQRLSNVKKTTVDNNIKRNKKKNDKA